MSHMCFRIRRDAFAASLLLALAAAACGGGGEDYGPDEAEPDRPPKVPNAAPLPAPTALSCGGGTHLTYENFGKGFLLDYCAMCHSSQLAVGARGGAAEGVNFDSAADVQVWRAAILDRAVTKGNMPPSGNVSDSDKSAAGEWLNCGAPMDNGNH